MDDAISAVLLIALVVLIVMTCLFITSGTLDYTVIKQCEKQGYWQTGQTRVICSVENQQPAK